MPLPRLPNAPTEYAAGFFSQLFRTLNAFFVELTTPGYFRCLTLNATRVDPLTGTRTVGLVPSTNLSANALAAAVTVTVTTTAEFPESGDAFIANTTTYDKITYTGKTSTTLTGIPAAGTGSLANGYTTGAVVVASGSTGDVYCDKLKAYALFIIP